jgi:hypothetical protein
VPFQEDGPRPLGHPGSARFGLRPTVVSCHPSRQPQRHLLEKGPALYDDVDGGPLVDVNVVSQPAHRSRAVCALGLFEGLEKPVTMFIGNRRNTLIKKPLRKFFAKLGITRPTAPQYSAWG